MAEKTYAGSDLASRLEQLPGWFEHQNAIRREYTTDGWPTTLMLVNLIGFLCEAADHHPDLLVSWGKVEVRLNTHTAGGVTDKDLELAQAIERQATWRPTGGALRGTTRKWIES
ncbi:MAG TPA: 4a-hydroxytetrahydrobiopterin dehydratase [Gemmatimonadales bacterium]|nr:4a-hydroxytetrahydrobiopterin dehydratase [Gemmatimonadales bacterium]